MGNFLFNNNDASTYQPAKSSVTTHHTPGNETTTTTFTKPTQQSTKTSPLRTTNTPPTPATSRGSSYICSQSQNDYKISQPAFQQVRHSANNYVIPAAESKERKESWGITPCQKRNLFKQCLQVCPQYNGHGCMAEPCRRLHICLYWATKTCYKHSCKCDHSVDTVHNTKLIEACAMSKHDLILNDSLAILSLRKKEQQICMFSILKSCSKKPCTRVHYTKNYLWEVKDCSGWIRMSCNQNDYLELMYSQPSEECVDLIPLQTHTVNDRNLQRLASLISKETSWFVDLETFKLKGTSTVYDIRRLSTASDLTSNVPVATRWLWYWQDDDECWKPYGEGADKKYYYVALSDHLEYILEVQNKRFVNIDIGNYCYSIDGKAMTQTNTTTGMLRKVRRRPTCSLVRRMSVKFDELFLTQPTTKKFLKFPVVPLSSEFLFVENLLKQTLTKLNIASIHRIQNYFLWQVYQNKKRHMVSLYSGDTTATNEQYLFHGTSHGVVDNICEENLDWKLWGTNVGNVYGRGTYFSNLAKLAHQYGKSNRTGQKVMLVVLVLVGKMTRGHSNMSFPPMNKCAGRNYDTTCNSDTDASIFVKYDRAEYYPAYVVKYKCDS